MYPPCEVVIASLMLLDNPKLSPGGGWFSHTDCGSCHSVGEGKRLLWLSPAKMAADRPFVEVVTRCVLLLDLPVAVSSAIWLGYRSLSCSWFKAKKYYTFSWNLTMCGFFLLVPISVSTTKKDMSSLPGGREGQILMVFYVRLYTPLGSIYSPTYRACKLVGNLHTLERRKKVRHKHKMEAHPVRFI